MERRSGTRVDVPKRPWPQRIIRNGFVLVVPLLLWNAIFWPRLPAFAGGRGEVPGWISVPETALRLGVFVLPLFLSLRAEGPARTRGGALYLSGLIIYFASWIPWLQGVELQSVLFLVGPYSTPMLVFAGIAALCRSRSYIAASTVFVLVHVYGGLIKGGVL